MDSKQMKHVYRVDTFAVPNTGREEFLGRVWATHELLRARSGFVRDLVLERPGSGGESNFITIVEWAGEEFIKGAGEAVQAMHKEQNFNPQETFQRLGIKAERGPLYRRVDAHAPGAVAR